MFENQKGIWDQSLDGSLLNQIWDDTTTYVPSFRSEFSNVWMSYTHTFQTDKVLDWMRIDWTDL